MSFLCHLRNFHNFNSQPHKEADESEAIENALEQEFQLTASQGG